MNFLNESLLNSWLRLTTTIINPRIVSELPYNESLVCNILYTHQMKGSDEKLTATDLCNETHMIKSLMNRTLNHLEEKHIITRTRSTTDKRQIFITFNTDPDNAYMRQHREILHLVDNIVKRIGDEKAYEILDLFAVISETADSVLADGKSENIETDH